MSSNGAYEAAVGGHHLYSAGHREREVYTVIDRMTDLDRERQRSIQQLSSGGQCDGRASQGGEPLERDPAGQRSDPRPPSEPVRALRPEQVRRAEVPRGERPRER